MQDSCMHMFPSSFHNDMQESQGLRPSLAEKEGSALTPLINVSFSHSQAKSVGDVSSSSSTLIIPSQSLGTYGCNPIHLQSFLQGMAL